MSPFLCKWVYNYSVIIRGPSLYVRELAKNFPKEIMFMAELTKNTMDGIEAAAYTSYACTVNAAI